MVSRWRGAGGPSGACFRSMLCALAEAMKAAMTYRRIHLHLCTHGSPTSVATVDYACALAASFRASLRVTSPRLTVHAPSHWLAGRMLAGMARDLEKDAAAKASELEAHIRQKAETSGIGVEILATPEVWPQRSDAVTVQGIAADICVLGLPHADADQRLAVEAWLFGAGRPCVLHPDSRTEPFHADAVSIAWDGSRSSARTVADALPILKRAKRIDVITITGEKHIGVDEPGAALASFLKVHEIDCVIHDRALAGRGIGSALLDGAEEFGADLLLMGAFGHARVHEFILGGATKQVLDNSTLPVLMSH